MLEAGRIYRSWTMSSFPSNAGNARCMDTLPEAAQPTPRPCRERRTNGIKPSATNLGRREDPTAKDSHLLNILHHPQEIGLILSALIKRKLRRQGPKRSPNLERRLGNKALILQAKALLQTPTETQMMKIPKARMMKTMKKSRLQMTQKRKEK